MIFKLYWWLSCKTKVLVAVMKSRQKRGLFHSCGDRVVFGKIGELHEPRLVSIGNNTCIGDYLYLTVWPSGDDINGYKTIKVKIGNKCNFGAMNHITCINRITIGDNVLTGKWVTITDNSHGTTQDTQLHIHPLERPLYSKGEIIISDDVWIGDGARIMPGVTIGKGAVVGANSVVTKDVPPYSVVYGVPAKIKQ